MPYSQRIDGLDQLRRELAVLPDEILDEGERIVGKGMLNIKRGAQRRVRDLQSGRTHLPHLPRSFSYDVTRRGPVIRGEGGADMEKLQGKLDIYIEHGTANTPPSRHWSRSLDDELSNFERYAEDFLARLVR